MQQPPERDDGVRFGRYVFKPADSPEEVAQLEQLNWRTFVSELGQHADDGCGRLVDKFHHKNRYFVALHDGRVVGMLAVHDQAPFSIARRLPAALQLDQLAPHPLEVRLLAVDPGHRRGLVFGGLGWAVLEHARRNGYSHLLISGVAERQRMYENMGFHALGPAVAEGRAAFVPMLATVEQLPAHIRISAVRMTRRLRRSLGGPGPPGLEALAGAGPSSVAAAFEGAPGLARTPRRAPADAPPAPGRDGPLMLTPGHAQPSPSVAAALRRPPMDHRSGEFRELFAAVRADLATLGRSADVAIFSGSGTLANDVIAGTLAADPTLRRGLVLSNGEFGRRLVTHARRAGLVFETLEWAWGRPWDLGLVEERLAVDGRIDWVWGVALESSTGMANDVPGLLRLSRTRRVRACLDAVSALGALPLDLSEAHLASGVANKALGGMAGLAFVAARPEAVRWASSARVAPSLDLRAALGSDGPLHTLASGPLLALHAALADYRDEEERRLRYARYLALGRHVRERLHDAGLPPLVDGPRASPVITTFEVPAGRRAEVLHARCREGGFVLGGRSGYLRERGWLQLATFGDVRVEDLVPLFERLSG